ncbi:hypothetical protein EVB97_006 [Rhizobium phage RHph_Y65]|uniref:Uncharacterized protein n=1 Tax=Rhizobium phage RHph_Y65 TaxID=2509785 RepID=A0A7S5UX76_9CAUD|nr:hypothetical protein PQC17_gp006 [Rhizobium phage RHph_Y65]QIG72564.1 hypothetical protein EVB97_006 [Rhizobium phage RHph_Y65]QIG77334.1 hypothetical protein EVB61_006 [Rhizobium phage RHph_TM21B]QIG77593.1 hypothetical protein EVB64_006 [Rhizobium phage RHph_TM61]
MTASALLRIKDSHLVIPHIIHVSSVREDGFAKIYEVTMSSGLRIDMHDNILTKERLLEEIEVYWRNR